MADTALAVEIPGLPVHLKCYTTASAGRTVITTTALRKGDTVFRQAPYAHTIHYRYKTTTCDACFLFTHADQALPYACANICGIRYCSTVCRDSVRAQHHGCDLIRQVQQQQQGKTKAQQPNKSMHTALSLLISMASSADHHDGQYRRPMADVLLMMQDASKVAMKKNTAAEVHFRSLVRSSEASAGGAASMATHQPPADGTYAQVLATVKLNALGIYDAAGEELGYALSPALAMVNHSCLPNCQQITTDGCCQLIALCDIAVGEELSYSYVTLDSSNSGRSRDERRRVIDKNWAFTCTCPRCQNLVDCRAFDTAHTCYCGAVCVQVDRRTGSCVCNPPRAGSTEGV
jgi:SET and MYND domain-containing protein